MRTDQVGDVLLRPAGPLDADAIGRVHVSSRAGAAMPPPVHPPEEVRDWLAGRLATDEVWVAEVGGRVVGYARLTDAWLDDLYVVPEAAGRGIGTALLDVAKARCPDGFCLWVFEMNAPARAFYAARGLVELERTDGSANQERAPDVRVAWPGRDPLSFFRGLVDEVDLALGDLLARRAALTAAIQPHKQQPGRDLERERAIALAMAQRAPRLGAERIERIVHVIITESLEAAR